MLFVLPSLHVGSQQVQEKLDVIVEISAINQMYRSLQNFKNIVTFYVFLHIKLIWLKIKVKKCQFLLS